LSFPVDSHANGRESNSAWQGGRGHGGQSRPAADCIRDESRAGHGRSLFSPRSFRGRDISGGAADRDSARGAPHLVRGQPDPAEVPLSISATILPQLRISRATPAQGGWSILPWGGRPDRARTHVVRQRRASRAPRPPPRVDRWATEASRSRRLSTVPHPPWPQAPLRHGEGSRAPLFLPGAAWKLADAGCWHAINTVLSGYGGGAGRWPDDRRAVRRPIEAAHLSESISISGGSRAPTHYYGIHRSGKGKGFARVGGRRGRKGGTAPLFATFYRISRDFDPCSRRSRVESGPTALLFCAAALRPKLKEKIRWRLIPFFGGKAMVGSLWLTQADHRREANGKPPR